MHTSLKARLEQCWAGASKQKIPRPRAYPAPLKTPNRSRTADTCYGGGGSGALFPFWALWLEELLSPTSPQKSLRRLKMPPDNQQPRGPGMQSNHFATQKWHSDDFGLRQLYLQLKTPSWGKPLGICIGRDFRAPKGLRSLVIQYMYLAERWPTLAPPS